MPNAKRILSSKICTNPIIQKVKKFQLASRVDKIFQVRIFGLRVFAKNEQIVAQNRKLMERYG